MARVIPLAHARGYGGILFWAVLGIAAAILIGCAKRETSSPSSSSATRAPQVLRLSQRNEPGDLDPATATLPDDFGILRALSEGLLIPGEDGSPQPGAAASFTVSPDGLIYTFQLRPEAQWSDGAPVTAGQFIDAYQRVLTPATAAPKASVFYPVKNAREFVQGNLTDFSAVGFRAPDPDTLVVTLAQPSPRFPYYVASGPWLPVRTDLVAKHGRAWTRPENFVGNGPFTLAEWRADQRIVVKKNPRWRDAANVRLAEIQFVRFDSGDSEDRAYRAGQIQATMSVPFTKVAVYERERPAELHRAPMIETRYLAFNTTRPALADARVRRALALAIDRRKLVERVLQGGQPIANRFVPAALRDAADDLAVDHHYDPEAARRLLAEAGVNGKNFPRLEVSAWSPSQTPVLEMIQASWRQELGIDVTITLREARVHVDALKSGNYDIGYIAAIPDVADAADLLGDFVSGAPQNNPHWSDPAFDELFASATKLGNRRDRSIMLTRAETRLLEAAPLTPLYFNTKIWLMSPRVRGWQEDGLWARCYQNTYLDEK